MKNRGKKIPVIAKEDLYGIIKKGEKAFIQSVLYTKETVLHNGMALYFHKDTPQKSEFNTLPKSLYNKPLGTTIEDENGQMIMVSMKRTIAQIGSYKSCLIITKNGLEYPSENLLGMKSIGEVFDKI